VDEISREDLASLLSEASEDASSRGPYALFHVSSSLKQRASDREEDPIHALRAGLDYHFLAYGEHRDQETPFGPMWEFDGRAYPMSADQMPEAVLELWADAVDVSTDALVRARYADLLWEVRYGDEAYRWCQMAIDSYLQAIDEGVAEVNELHDAGRRAMELALQINDRSRQESVIERLQELTRRSLGDRETPGVALPVLELISSLRPDLHPADLGELVDDAIDVYGSDPWHLESALGVKAKLAGPEERADLWLAQVDAFANLADRSEGLVRYAHLQRAIEMAEERDLRDRARELRVTLEGISEDELGLKQVSVEVQIPTEEIDKFVAVVVGQDTLEAGLARFGSYLPLGEPEESRTFVRELLDEHPLQALVTRMTIGPENALLRATQTPEEHEVAALIDHQTRSLSFFGFLAIEILSQLIERYGAVSSKWEWFESDIIERGVAERIGHAIELYERDDFDGSASLIAPRLERVVRACARAVGVATTQGPDRSGNPGGVKGLGNLLSSMTGRLPEGTRQHLRILLSETTGLNLRNRISHGLIDEASAQEAALLIHAACHLALLGPRAQDEVEGTEEEE